MGIIESRKNNIMPFAVATALFIVACVMQQVDGFVEDKNLSGILALASQYIYLGIIAYWTVSVINRVSDKNTRVGLTATIILMSMLLLLKLVKYNVATDETAKRYLWYSYYIPQCFAPAVLMLTVLKMARKSGKPLSKAWNVLLFIAGLLVVLVFTNDLHEKVFFFPEGLQSANEVYVWNFGYYLILVWIAGLYLVNGALLFIKCRISHCRKNAWIPLALFFGCLTCCILREVFNPAFIKMPETVVFSVVIVCESLIRIGFIPSNTDHAKFFDVSDVSAIITDTDFRVRLSSENAPSVTREDIISAFKNGDISLSKDLTLKAKPITGGRVFWTEDYSVINKINSNLEKINTALAEESHLITAENQLKEQRLKIEEQNNLYGGIFRIARPYLKKIEKCFASSFTDEEKDEALKKAVVYGVLLKRRSNLMLMTNEGKISLSELVYSLRESADALTFCNVYSSVFADGDGDFPSRKIEFIFEFFQECIERALPDLSACLVRLSYNGGILSCRIACDNVNSAIDADWMKQEREDLCASLSIEKSDETLYATLSFSDKGVIK